MDTRKTITYFAGLVGAMAGAYIGSTSGEIVPFIVMTLATAGVAMELADKATCPIEKKG